MEYKTTHIVYFSPTHTSEKIARSIALGIGSTQKTEIDLTRNTDQEVITLKDTLVIIAVPVYAGRIAPVGRERIGRLRGENTPAILAVVYGNRDYEDALIELRDIVVGHGFFPLAAGAFIGEHSFSRKNMPIAAGRPDGTDQAKAADLGARGSVKLRALSSFSVMPRLYIKGNIPYREVASSAPAAPLTCAENCTLCGDCLEFCPTKAIYVNGDGQIDTDKNECIKCCACVKECPSEARIFETPYTAMLHANFSARKEPEIFL